MKRGNNQCSLQLMNDTATTSNSRNSQLCSISHEIRGVNDILPLFSFTLRVNYTKSQALYLLTLALMFCSHDSTVCIVYYKSVQKTSQVIFLYNKGNKILDATKWLTPSLCCLRQTGLHTPQQRQLSAVLPWATTPLTTNDVSNRVIRRFRWTRKVPAKF